MIDVRLSSGKGTSRAGGLRGASAALVRYLISPVKNRTGMDEHSSGTEFRAIIQRRRGDHNNLAESIMQWERNGWHGMWLYGFQESETPASQCRVRRQDETDVRHKTINIMNRTKTIRSIVRRAAVGAVLHATAVAGPATYLYSQGPYAHPVQAVRPLKYPVVKKSPQKAKWPGMPHLLTVGQGVISIDQ
jgi:hypothetical protein